MDDDYRERAELRRRTMTARVARSPEEARRFEREREAGAEPFQRAEAIWPLVRELTAMRGDDGSQLRLDRSLARVERRTR